MSHIHLGNTEEALARKYLLSVYDHFIFFFFLVVKALMRVFVVVQLAWHSDKHVVLIGFIPEAQRFNPVPQDYISDQLEFRAEIMSPGHVNMECLF